MKISIIIPTHNRAEILRNAIESVIRIRDEADFEFVIVDNNSSDTTKQVVESYSSVAKYVFEGNTSFTMARKAGANNSTGDVLLYLDDDVLVREGSLKNIIKVFSDHPDCGVIAGRIDPKFTAEPPKWTLECQRSFNGWSLYNEDTYSFLRKPFQQVPSAAGPMMAIRRDAYQKIGGFPPDTVGVETNRGRKIFNKLYIGPGDYGLCLKARKAGFKVYYSKDIGVYHVIPPIRFTIPFWRSRMIGEGYCEAITERAFFNSRWWTLWTKRIRRQAAFHCYEHLLCEKLRKAGNGSGAAYEETDGISIEELWVHYHKAYLDMDSVLRRYPSLWRFLWKVGNEGVNDQNFEQIMVCLPEDYKKLVADEYVYDPRPMKSVADQDSTVRNFGLYQGTKLLQSGLALSLIKVARFGRRYLAKLRMI